MPTSDISLPMSSSPAPGADASAPGSSGTFRRLDREEFVRRFREVSRALWCIAAGHSGARSNAEDIVQQAALIALERLEEFDADTSFLAWMSKIVRLTTMNEVHKDQRRKTTAADPLTMDAGLRARRSSAEPLPIAKDGSILPDQESFDDDILRALEGLDSVARSCLLLRVCLNVPYKELSAALDIPQGTAMSHVDRARRAVRDHLLRRRETSASARRASEKGVRT